MKFNLSTIYLMIQFSSALSHLPAPNVSIISSNYFHKLQWDPGPGTPPGTTYDISCRVSRKKTQCPVTKITPTTSMLTLKDPKKYYTISVQAVHNLSKSALTNIKFAPFQDTVISPPTLVLTGCGTCLNLTIIMPEMNLNTSDTHLSPTFRIKWKKNKQTQVSEVKSDSTNYIINNLDRGVEYSVKVYPEAVVNKNLKASEWYTASTSVLEPSNVPPVLAGVTVLCVVVGVPLLVLWYCLFFSGYLCLKERLPRVLMTALVRAKVLILEKTIPDPVSSNKPESLSKGRKFKAKPHCGDLYTAAVDEEEEEEEEFEDEEGNNCYMDRVAEQVSDTSIRSDYQNASGAGVSCQGDSGSLSCTMLPAEIDLREEHVGKSMLEDKPEILIEEIIGDQLLGHGLHGVKKEMKEKEGSGNINLFSVTLGAMAREEEEQQQTTVDILEIDQQVLLPFNLNKTLNLGRRESESEMLKVNQTLLESMQTKNPAQLEDCEYAGRGPDPANTRSGYLVTHAGNVQTVDQTEEDEDEEEDFSGYMGH